jgi:hypothetical protein
VRRFAGDAFDGVDKNVRWEGRKGHGEAVAPGMYVERVPATAGLRTDTVVGKLAFVR